MTFEKMYEEQKRFQEVVKATYGIDDKEKFMKDLCIHLHSEIAEVLSELNWKMHKRTITKVDENKLLHECIDVIKYAMSLPASWGFSAEEVERVFWEKSKVVEQKFRQEIIAKDFSADAKIIGVDCDGVILKYPEGFIDFAWRELKPTKPKEGFVMHRYNLYNDLADYLEISKDELHHIKHRFRAEGHKRFLDAVEGAQDFINWARNEYGAKVILLTARPVEDYPNIFYDTIESLKRNKIGFDGIYFSQNKEVEITRRFPNIEFFVEDSAENAEKIAQLGKTVYLINTTYNQEVVSDSRIIRVMKLSEIPTKVKG